MKIKEPKIKPKLCECGCGEYANLGRRFVNGHNRRKPKSEPQLCECGCGEYANSGHQYIKGHYWLGRKHSDKTREKQRIIHVKHCNDSERKRLKEMAIKQWAVPLAHEKASKRTIEQFKSPLERKKMRERAIKQWANPIMREKQKERAIKQWNNPKQREKFINAANKYWENLKSHEQASAAQQHVPYDEWENFATEKLYCPAFNEKCRESNREKYGRKCFLTGLSEAKNITKNGKKRKLSVHHVDMNKQQGCDGINWKLVPLCMGWHGKAHTKLWETRIIWLLKNVW